MPVLGALPWVMDESLAVRIVLGVLALMAAVAPGAVLEDRSWARGAEVLRVSGGLVAMIALAFLGVTPIAPAALGLSVLGTAVGLGAAVAVRTPEVAESV